MTKFHTLHKAALPCAAFILMLTAYSAAVDLTLENTTGAAGHAVEINLNISSGQGVAGIQARIDYDDALAFSKVELGALTQGFLLDYYDNAGVLSLVIWAEPTATLTADSGNVAKLTFVIPAGAPDLTVYPLNFQGLDGGDPGPSLEDIPLASASNAGAAQQNPQSLQMVANNGQITVLTPPPDQLYGCLVDRVYQDLLYRAPTTGEHDAAVTALAGGQTVPAYIQNVMDSDEFTSYTSFICRCYFAIYNNNYTTDYRSAGYRMPTGLDGQDLDYYMAGMQAAPDFVTGQRQVLTGFINAPEWTDRVGNINSPALVTFLYENILGRPAEDSGHAYWLNLLQTGQVTTETVILQFITSPEAANKYSNLDHLTMCQLGLLDRDYIDRAELIDYMGRIERGEMNVEDVIWAYTYGSAEYETRLAGLAPACDLPPSGVYYISFQTPSTINPETLTTVNIPVTLASPALETVTVQYQVIPGSAGGGGDDYTLDNGSLTFGIGSVMENIAIIVKDDAIPEYSESFQIKLNTPSANARIWPVDTHRYTIVDNEPFPPIETGVFRHGSWQLYQ